MRQVKFRAWDIKNQKMIPWERLHLEFQDGSTTIWIPDNKSIEDGFDLENFELMQFTGIKDKNGKEIYEGDLAWDSHNEVTGKIIFDEGKFLYESEDLFEACDEIEIIGNVFENPEVLKEASHENL